MRMPSAIAAASVGIALFAAGFAVGHGVHHSTSVAPEHGANVLGQVFETTTTSTTTTSTTLAAPQAPPTSQAPARSVVTTTTAKPATAAAATPTTVRTTVRQVNGACGSGSAQASLQASIHPRSLSPGSGYETDAVATVDNNVNKAIQIDALSVRLVFADGSSQVYNFDQAIGSVVQPGQSSRFGVALLTQNPPTEVQLNSFGFHTAGQPQCPGRTT